ncbi:MAG: hypothetical protein WBH20_09375 [Oceanisphaera sp.]|uniref:hypothetical protein n=1 Tax=Oceanisphaera sp. TaxID=1929979 RepID=UPI003C779223
MFNAIFNCFNSEVVTSKVYDLVVTHTSTGHVLEFNDVPEEVFKDLCLSLQPIDFEFVEIAEKIVKARK